MLVRFFPRRRELPVGLGVDVEDVAVLGEAVDERAEAGGVVEDGPPLLVSEVGRDHDGALLVSAADDVEEEVGRSGVAGDVSELVQLCRVSPFTLPDGPVFEQFDGPAEIDR